MKKITGFDCPILDISDSKMGKVGLVILVDMSTTTALREGNRHLKLTRKNLKCWKQPSIYAWLIANSGLKGIDDVSLLIINEECVQLHHNYTIRRKWNGVCNRS